MIKASILLIIATWAVANCATLYNYAVIDNALGANYDPRVRPFAGEKPTEVEVSIYAIRLYKFNEVDKEFYADLYFTQKWLDPRLAYTANDTNDSFNQKLNQTLAERIWIPETFISLSHHDKLNLVTQPTVFVSIKPEGQVFISGR